MREIARKLGSEPYLKTIGIADERGEIAASYQGRTGYDVGAHTVVMDNCPKSVAAEMMLRAMRPEVMMTDEIGDAKDEEAIYRLLNAGVKFICSAHGFGEEDCKGRPVLKKLLSERLFECRIVLSRRMGAGTVEGIYL